MAARELKYSAEKNDIYDRDGLFMTRTEKTGHTARNDWCVLEFMHYYRLRVCPTPADIVYLYRDLFMP